MATDWEPEHMLEVMTSVEGYREFVRNSGLYHEKRPVTKFEKRGHRLSMVSGILCLRG